MTKPPILFNVVISGFDTVIRKVEPRDPAYATAAARMVLRQRDAIELFRSLKERGRGYDGTYTFKVLDTAKTFAMLRLGAGDQAVQNNLDRILGYDGTESSSDA